MAKLAKTAARGYGSRHRALRAEYQFRMDHGEVFICHRCRRVITPTQFWDLDHTDDRAGYQGPAHRSCNRRAGLLKARRGPVPLRRWVF
jgi:hypothetical protein